MPRLHARRPVISGFESDTPAHFERQPFRTPTRTPRLMLRGRSALPGNVDGAWWPWTTNLTSELHDLINAVTPRLGPAMRVGFEWNATSLAQRRIDTDDHIRVHGAGDGQPPDVMRLYGAHDTSLTLLVIPADTTPEVAHERMRLAMAGHLGPPPGP